MLEDKARLTKLQDLRNAQVEKYGLTKKQLSQMLSPYDNYKEIGSQPKLKNLRKKEPPKRKRGRGGGRKVPFSGKISGVKT